MTRGLALLALGCALLIVLLTRGGLAHENPTDWIGQERRKNAKNELCCWRCRWGGETKCLFAPVGGS